MGFSSLACTRTQPRAGRSCVGQEAFTADPTALQAGEGQHSIGYINDSIALHAVRVPEHCTGTGAVTLHLYSPPIRRVRLYEPDNDRIVQRVPGFFTVGLGRARREQEQQTQQAAEGAAAGGAGAQVGHVAEASPLLYDI